MANTEIEYLYRDAYNYKQQGIVVVTGWSKRLVEQIVDSLDAGEFFLAEEVGLPSVREAWPTHHDDADHVWHEWVGAERTEARPTHPERSLEDLAGAFVAAAAAQWPEKRAQAALDEFLALTPQGT